MKLSIRPIENWPGELRTASQRVRSPFNASCSDTFVLLDRELRALRAKVTAVQIAVNEGQIKRDGGLYASARPDHPGVVLSFQTAAGSFRYAADRFTHWHANLRAIALGLEALRRIERYGIGSGTEQYTGYLQLGPGGMSYDDALSVVAGLVGESPHKVRVHWQYEDTRKVTHRAAMRAAHPDTGGVSGMYVRLQEAVAVLDAGRE